MGGGSLKWDLYIVFMYHVRFDPVKALPIPLRADIDDRLGWVEGHEKNLLAALGPRPIGANLPQGHWIIGF